MLTKKEILQTSNTSLWLLVRKLAPSFIFFVIFLYVNVPVGESQPSDQNDELLRFEYSALLSVEQEDFHGAALTMGKAALLSSLLSKDKGRHPTNSKERHLIQEKVYRTREQVYRAYALFQQSGESIPAPSAVCTTLKQGNKEAKQANHQLKKIEKLTTELEELKTEVKEWMLMIKELQDDFHCAT